MKGYVRTIGNFYKSYVNLLKPNSINTRGISMMPDDIKSSIIFNLYNTIIGDWLGIKFDEIPDVMEFRNLLEGASYQYIDDTINSNSRFYRIYLNKPVNKYMPEDHVMLHFSFTNGVNVVVSIIANNENNNDFEGDIKIILNEIQYIAQFALNLEYRFDLCKVLTLKIFCLLEYRKTISTYIPENDLVTMIKDHYDNLDPFFKEKSDNLFKFFKEISELYYEDIHSVISLLDTSQIYLYKPLLFEYMYRSRNKSKKELLDKINMVEEKECKDN